MATILLIGMLLAGTMTETTTTTTVSNGDGYCYEETYTTVEFVHPEMHK